jgi:nicotinate-nucleotide adenylyltransferase
LALAGMRVGLFGGTFNPAHAGHAHVAAEALKRLHLHQVWWLVTPQNPLKPQARPLQLRMASAAAMTQGSRHIVTAIETDLGTRYTADTLKALRRHYPGVRFFWITGADALRTLERWRRWEDILQTTPMLVVSRPGCGARDRFCKPLLRFSGALCPVGTLRQGKPAPAVTYVPARLVAESSTRLRAQGLQLEDPAATSPVARRRAMRLKPRHG